ncbi:MAG: hypothetical protein DRJ56_07810 [Thermoprotei archaeon]|nr:MAG: hypothetical protein DRJ56_07810 [Thermoprotei archaeon]
MLGVSEEGGERVKELAEAKALLERRVRELEEELRLYRMVLRLIDEALSRLSFVPASELVQGEEEREEPLSRYPIVSRSGERVAEVLIYRDRMIVRPTIKFRRDSPPFRGFFIDRILKRLKEEDRRRVSVGEIAPSEAFDYEIVEDEEGYVRELVIRNYRSEETLRELRRALKWTLVRVRRG